jgi:hypothetical protein
MLHVGAWNVGFPGNWLIVDVPYGLTNGWNHLVLTLADGNVGTGSLSIFFNGVLADSAVFQRVDPGNALHRVGVFGSGWAVGSPNYATAPWIGSMGDIRIYNRALSSNEVAQLYAIESTPPSITTPPSTQTAEMGSIASFSVDVTNTPPGGTYYQWYLSGTNALGSATSASLELANVQPAQAGAYTVVVTNLLGAVTSAPALLSVIAPVEKRVVPAVGLPGASGSLLHLEYADSLVTAPTWSSLTNVTLSIGPQLCFDLSQPLPAQRFYRAWQTNEPQFALAMSLATELPLTGAIGSSVRIDYINQFGPTNAWVTLDMVTLTNSPQLYFDVTMFRQPARLYRLVGSP